MCLWHCPALHGAEGCSMGWVAACLAPKGVSVVGMLRGSDAGAAAFHIIRKEISAIILSAACVLSGSTHCLSS